jgi:hypothetical protein
MIRAKCIKFPEPELIFSPDGTCTSPFPVSGLREFHPFDSKISRKFSEIKPFIVTEKSYVKNIDVIWNDLVEGYSPPTNWQNFDVAFPSFETVFETKMSEIKEGENIRILGDFDGSNIDQKIDSAIREYLQLFEKKTNNLLFIVLSREIGFLAMNNYFQLKKKCIDKNVVSQIIRPEITFNKIHEKWWGNFLWNLSSALYTKVGGIPWKMKPMKFGDCYLGLSFHLRKSSRIGPPEKRYVGLAEIFNKYGVGVDFTFCNADVEDLTVTRSGFVLHLSAEKMYELIYRALDRFLQEIKEKGDLKNLIIHKTTTFDVNEIASVEKAVEDLGLSCKYAAISIKEMLSDANVRTHRLYSTSTTKVERGIFEKRSEQWGFLHSFFTEPPSNLTYPIPKRKGTDIPLEIRINPKSSCLDQLSIEDLSFQILGLTKMNWGSVDFRKEPVTLKFAKVAGEFVKEGIPVSRLTDIRHII